ncbi:MAG: DUF58 domain-containing protein [Gaiellaceae bacterium]
MSSRGRAILGIGVAVWIAAWLFGSRALFPVAAGLVLAVPLAVAWVRLSLQRPVVRREWGGHGILEGEDVEIAVVLETTSRVPLPTALVRERIGRLGEHALELRRGRDGSHRGAYRLRRVPRGRHGFEPMRVSVTDPWRLAEASLAVEEQEALLVYPRLVELERLFSDAGAGALDGRRFLLHRPAGFELHSVREHQQGESLRRVHWPSTARTGVLMVKELEDSPRDEVTVLLDGDAAGAVGVPPDSAFDTAVRAAGSILLAHVRRGRRAVLVLNTRGRDTQAVASEGPEWGRALELLAGAEPDARASAGALLEAGAGPAARSLDVVVVTSRPEPALVSRLLERTSARRSVALVYVDAPTFAGRPPAPQPALLRLQSAGVQVAVVRKGDDLAAVLAPAMDKEAAHA